MTSPGWYEDPEGGGWRWWDGTSWGPTHESGDPVTSSSAGRRSGPLDLGIDFSSGWPARVAAAVAVVAGCAAVLAGVVLLYTYLIGPLPSAVAAVLVVVAVPVVLVGQLVVIGILQGRAAGRWRSSPGERRWWSRGLSVHDLRGGLPWSALAVAAGLFYGVVILGLVAGPWGSIGGELPGVPTDDPADCEYLLENHGEYRCLTAAEHERERLSMQRFTTTVVFGFLVAQCTVASGEVLLHRRRVTRD